MTDSFEQDVFPGKPRVLFIGLGNSSHTLSWIGLLEKAEINVRLFSMPGSQPPLDWPIKTYISRIQGKNSNSRQYQYHEPDTTLKFVTHKIAKKLGYSSISPEDWLAQIIREWQPHVIHTLGVFDGQGGEYFQKVRENFQIRNIGKWVLQLRGGSDMALRHNLPECQLIIQKSLERCDYVISDNYKNIEFCEAFGISRAKFAPFVPVPGTGGMDLSDSTLSTLLPPSKRERIILWPKAYDCKWSLAVPVLEAIKISWEKISPCEIHMLAITSDTLEWLMALPEEIRRHCHTHNRLPRSEVLSLMKKARIMLAPSLVDGVPNSLYEAMAYGSFPIVSPLETITPVIKNEVNTLFARNLYPDEIAAAIIRGMTDDKLVDKSAAQNQIVVRKLADRNKISKEVIDFYQNISTPKLP